MYVLLLHGCLCDIHKLVHTLFIVFFMNMCIIIYGVEKTPSATLSEWILKLTPCHILYCC